MRFGYGPSWAPMTQEQEMESLKGQAEWLKDQLHAVNRCIAELEERNSRLDVDGADAVIATLSIRPGTYQGGGSGETLT